MSLLLKPADMRVLSLTCPNFRADGLGEAGTAARGPVPQGHLLSDPGPAPGLCGSACLRCGAGGPPIPGGSTLGPEWQGCGLCSQTWPSSPWKDVPQTQRDREEPGAGDVAGGSV